MAPSPSPPPPPYPFTPLITIFAFLIFVSFANGDDATIMSKLAQGLDPTPPGWSGSTPCKWTGVKCDSSNRVTSISLAGKALSGQLPSDLNQLTNLKTLSLQRNNLSGPLPSLANLTFLQEAYLDNNAFSSVPSSFLAGLTSLQNFTIGENSELSPWTIPNDITDSSSLVSFTASNANIVGTMPDIFGSFPSLRNLRLSYNNLTGSLPPSLAGSGIQNLLLNNQRMGLSGRIDVLGAMSQLSQAWLHANKFSGPIPDLSNCTALSDLQIRDNQITGIVPSSLSTLPKLANITLQNNKLQGPVPEFGNGVQATLGSTNNFCDSKPGPCDPQVTTLLEVAGALGYPMTLAESWKGNDPCQDWSFVTCDKDNSVSVINFGKQHWTGTISSAMANLTSLRSLFLNDNNITGPIPDNLAKLEQLQVVDVSNNNLSGKIPGFSSKVTVKTSGNPLLGTNASPGGTGGSPVPAGSNKNTSVSSPAGTPSGNQASTGSSLSNWAIASIICASVVLIGLVSFFVFKYLAKQRQQKLQRGNEKGMNGIMGNMNSYGEITSEVPSQSSADIEHMHVYDGGNVAIPIEVLREVTNNFSDDNILGKGGFGIVYKGALHDGTEIAVKRMEANAVTTKGMNEFQAEIGVLTKVRHRHLVALLGFCVNGNERLLVYEYMPSGTLGEHLFEYQERGVSPLTWKQRVAIALDVARGIEYLHSLAQQSFIHRDLKPSNILLGDDLRAKVSDFGLVKNAPDGKYSLETRLAGTFGYLAPEYAATGRVTIKVDVFAFGVVLMELITGRKSLDDSLPEDRSNLITWFKKFMTNKDSIRNLIDPSLAPDEETFESICKVAELAGYCTSREPYQRPDMGHAVNVLVPLVDQWKPTANDEDDNIGIDLHMSLPQALQRWQNNLDSSTMTSDFFNSHSHTARP